MRLSQRLSQVIMSGIHLSREPGGDQVTRQNVLEKGGKLKSTVAQNFQGLTNSPPKVVFFSAYLEILAPIQVLLFKSFQLFFNFLDLVFPFFEDHRI